MIQRELTFGTAILTSIAFEDILAGEVDSFIRCIHIPVKPYDGRHGEAVADGTEPMTVGRSHHFAFIKVNKHKCPLH